MSKNAMAQPRPRSERGFTLVELLVGVALAAIVVLIFYAFVVSAERASRVQADATKAMERLDGAMSMLKADLRTAGYLGTPATPRGELTTANYNGATVMCAPTPDVLFPVPPDAIRVLPPPATPVGFPGAFTAAAGVPRNDGLLLTGAYRVRQAVPVLGGSPLELLIPPLPEVVGSGLGLPEQPALHRRLIDGGTVALSTRLGGTIFVPIGNVGGVVGTQQLPLSNVETVMARVIDEGELSEVCRFTGLMGGALIDDGMQAAIVHTVRYHVLPRSEVEPAGATIGEEADAEFVLVRDILRGTNIDQVVERQIVARNVVEFLVSFDQLDTAAGFPRMERVAEGADSPFLAGNFGVRGCGGMGCDTELAARPERARHAYITLAVRFDHVIPNLNVLLPAGQDIVRAVEVGPDGEQTRVLVARTEVPLTNFAIANIEPRPML